MKKTLKKSISLFLITVAICSVFVVDASAYSFVDREEYFDAHKGFTAKGELILSTSAGSECWFAGRTTINWPHQEIAVRLYCANTYGGTVNLVASNIYQSENGSYSGIYTDHDHVTWPYQNYSWHQVAAYDFQWFYYSTQTDAE